jgi:hypothetical protein
VQNVFFSISQSLPISLSSLAIVIAIRDYRRKSGMRIHGSFSVATSVDCDDPFVSEYALENLKDRTVTVYATYLRVGLNHYIELEDFEKSPLILKPFETYKRTLGPIEFYASSNRRVDMRRILGGGRRNSKLVLSSSEGKYIVRKWIKRWHPVTEFFSNHSTGLLQVIRLSHKGVALGGRIPFTLDLKYEDGSEAVIPMHRDDHQLTRFKDLKLTQESLKSAQSFRRLLQQRKDEGVLKCKSFEVQDLERWRANARSFYDGSTVVARPIGFIRYHLVGRYATWLRERQMQKNNGIVNRSKKSPNCVATVMQEQDPADN